MWAGYIFFMRWVVAGGHRIPHLQYVLIVLFLIKHNLPVDDLDLFIASLQELFLIHSAHWPLLVLQEHDLSLLLLFGQLLLQWVDMLSSLCLLLCCWCNHLLVLILVVAFLKHAGGWNVDAFMSTSGPDLIASSLATLAHSGANARMLDEYTALWAARTIGSQSPLKLRSLIVGRAMYRLRIVEIWVDEVIALLNLILSCSSILLNRHVLCDSFARFVHVALNLLM